MNAVEIEEAVSELARAPLDADEFPFSFLAAFGHKQTTIERLRKGVTNKSDVGGVLQRNNIHLAVTEPGATVETLARLRASPQTERQKAKFILATDGEQVEAEEIGSGDVLSCRFVDFGNNFGFFLPLAGISTVKEVKNNPIDIKATGRLNRLYVQLLKENRDWGSAAKRADLNRFMARLIFCFFAEDTGIFNGEGLFTATIQQISEADGSDTDFVLKELFRAMNLDPRRKGQRDGVRSWADVFPYVNGGLFQDDIGCPNFSRTSRAYLLRAGELDWKTINPDIFGSMIQAVADDDERGELGMHYTSVPNIQKVLDPLFLDDLREQLEEAGTNKRKLYNLRQRLSRIRVFDPACGSGNFLVIAYIRMREIEDEIMRRRGEPLERSAIRLTQFYGIEIKSFAAEIARLSLLIAEFQCDVRFIGQAEARALVLPLHATGNIVTGNALRLDWEEVCPPAKPAAEEQDLGGPTGRFALEGGGDEWETYICGNPPYLGAKKKTPAQVSDMKEVGLGSALLLDYVCGFIVKGIKETERHDWRMALVSTSSICQGEQVALLWSRVLKKACIGFAYRPFKWSNSAKHNAGVWCTIVGLERDGRPLKRLFDGQQVKSCENISPYLVSGPAVICQPRNSPLSDLSPMRMGSNPVDGKHLIRSDEEFQRLQTKHPNVRPFFKKYGGTQELVDGTHRWCLWVEDSQVPQALQIPTISEIIASCKDYREGAGRDARKAAIRPHAFCYSTYEDKEAVHVGNTIGNALEYVPAAVREKGFVSSHAAFTVYGAPLVEFAIITSGLHRVWAETVAGRLGNGTRYGNTVVYNTFPMPKLTRQNKADLTHCADEILLAREAHFPASIGELYDPEAMPADLRAAHDRNDETLERIYIGRRFRNDTERLEKLFEMYTKMTAKKEKAS